MIHWLYSLLFILLLSFMQVRDEEDKAIRSGLEQVVTKCLSDSTGRPVVIDGEIFLCGIVRTGQKI